jgi:hypothetical protein
MIVLYPRGSGVRVEGHAFVTERRRDQSALTAHLEATATEAFVKASAGRMQGGILKFDASNGCGLLVQWNASTSLPPCA